MKLTIFAATGGIGRQALQQAVAAGHHVTAVVRDPQKLPEAVRSAEKVTVVTADLAAPDPTALESALQGADAVLSGLGPRSNADAGIATTPNSCHSHQAHGPPPRSTCPTGATTPPRPA
jgi:putative NADH-flavin reductase